MIKIITRTKYLIYYFSQLDWKEFNRFFSYVKAIKNKSTFRLWIDVIGCSYKYNMGLIDYFKFKFYDKEKTEREKWMGTGYKYEYDLIMNPKSEREILQNKMLFLSKYSKFINHSFCTIDDLQENNEKARKVLQNHAQKIVIKDALGQCGWGVEVKNIKDFSRKELVTYMKKKGFNLVEEFIMQHSDLNKLSPSGLNTIRVITQINNDGMVDIIGTTLRITVNSEVDNMAMGNIAASIDLNSGIVIGPGVYQDIQKDAVKIHPITREKIVGFRVPCWEKVVKLCKDAALYNTSNRSIGWDVAITENGPSFVEGNHNWCKFLWQLPERKGLKSVLQVYLESYLHKK